MSALVPLFVAIPLSAAFVTALAGRRSDRFCDALGILTGLVQFAFSCFGVYLFQQEGLLVYAVGAWPPPIGISMVLDGLSVFMLTTVNLIALLVVLFSVDYMARFTGKWQFYSLFLLMLAGMNGVVLSGDLFNLFVFLEVASVASYSLVAFGTEKHELEAAFKYAVMGSLGSLFVLIAIVWLYAWTSTLNMADMAIQIQAHQAGPLLILVAAIFLMGFGLKAALVPFHAWLPDAHPSAPAPISAMLSGVLIKSLGIYAICRVFFSVIGMNPPLASLLTTLGILSMLIGVVLAVGQWDLKRLLAYHSISQVGYIILGIGLGTPLGLLGAMFHLFNHSVFKSLLFLNSGSVEQATGTRDLRRMGGLGRKMPVTGGTTLVASMSIAGVPPFNGFWSKLLIILAAIEADRYWLAFWAILASLLTLASFTKVLKYAFMGPLPERFRGVTEASALMKFSMIVLALICIAGGLMLLPGFQEVFLDPASGTLAHGTAAAREILARCLP
jgi:multicomponent Na+:H+ antiporter subunit D